MSVIIKYLDQVKLFQELEMEEKQKIADITILRDFYKKEPVFHEGTTKEAVFFICEGLIKTFKTDVNGNEQIVNILREGDLFPHTGFFDHRPYPATAETLTDVRLLAIPLKAFEAIMMKYPAIAVKVMKVMGDKIRELQTALQELTGQDVQHRIISFLLKLGRMHKKSEDQPVHIHLPITHQEIANLVGTRRETVNRVLNNLKRLELIEVSRSGIVIYDVDRLEKSSVQ
jgi:CRP/FNR family cyclic AMP-dependent transcriptional regulator